MLATRSTAYLAAILSFAYIQHYSLGGVPVTILELSLLLLLATYVVEKAWRHERFPDPRRLAYFWPVALLLVAALLAVLFAPDRRAAAGIFKAYFVEPALVGSYHLGTALVLRGTLGVSLDYGADTRNKGRIDQYFAQLAPSVELAWRLVPRGELVLGGNAILGWRQIF